MTTSTPRSTLAPGRGAYALTFGRMYLQDFQFVLREHDFELYGRARDIWTPIEVKVRKAIPKRFHFGGVGKIVLELGPEKEKREKYRELLGVGLYHVEVFDVHDFLATPRPAAIAALIDLTEKSALDLCARFSTEAAWLFSVLDQAKQEAEQVMDVNRP